MHNESNVSETHQNHFITKICLDILGFFRGLGGGGDGGGGDDGGGGYGCGCGDGGYGCGGGDGGGGMPLVHVIDTGSQWSQLECKGENDGYLLEGLYGEEEGHCRSYLQEGCYPLVIRVLAYYNRAFMEPA